MCFFSQKLSAIFFSFSREGITDEQDTIAQRESENFEPEVSGSGLEESVQAQKLAENLAMNNLPLLRSSEGTIVKRKTFGAVEDKISAGNYNSYKRSKIVKPTSTITKNKEATKSSIQGQKKTEPTSENAALSQPVTKVAEKPATNSSGNLSSPS